MLVLWGGEVSRYPSASLGASRLRCEIKPAGVNLRTIDASLASGLIEDGLILTTAVR